MEKISQTHKSMKETLRSTIKGLAYQWREYSSKGKYGAAYIVRLAIIKEFKTNIDKYSVDFILDTLLNVGGCPTIVCDPSYGFAVTDHSWGHIMGNDHEYVVHIHDTAWHPLVGLAVKHYIENLE